MLISFTAAALYRYARASASERAYQSLEINDLNIALSEERLSVCRDSLLDVLATLSVVAEGAVSYQAAVTATAEAHDMEELSSAASTVETVVREFTPLLATHRAREQRNRETEELAEMWRGRLRTSRPASADDSRRATLRSAFFGD
jgi:hypothetical protein